MNEHPKHTDLLAKWLQNQLTDEEKQLLETEQGDLSALQQLTDDIAAWEVSPMDINAGLADLNSRKQKAAQQKRPKILHLAFKIAASLTLLLVCYVVWDYYFNSIMSYQTGVAQTKEIILPSGSIVKLDVASSLSYDKRGWDNKRKVSFEGQAFFDISPGVSFKVKTTNASINVLGTKFNVATFDDQFEVQCFEGKLQLKSGNQVTEMGAGKTVRLKNRQFEQVESPNASPDWIQGFSEFQKVPLSEVVQTLQRYYPLEIILPNRFRQQLFSGRFVHDNVDNALISVFSPMEIKYELKADGRVEFE